MLLLVILMPVLITLLVWVFFKHKFHWVELIVPTIAVGIFTLVAYNTQKSNAWTVEYNGHLIVEARYYEAWETYIKKECSRQVADGHYYTGFGKNRRIHTKYKTVYYDCSYCDYNSEYYTLISKEGQTFSTTKSEYKRLRKLWNSKEVFIDLERDINYKGSCGDDGDMYYISWDKDPLKSKTYTTTTRYQNFLKYNTSIFNYPEIDSINLKYLYKYPNIEPNGFQNSVIGLGLLSLPDSTKLSIKKYLNYFNGDNGVKNKLRYYTLFYKNRSIDIAKQQEALWLGGNQNEMVVCVGTDGTKITWVYAFGWCDNKITHVSLREDIMKNDFIYMSKFYNAFQESKGTFKYKDFKDFDYIHFEPTRGQLLFIFIGSFIITIICLLIAIFNKFNFED